MRRFPFLVWLAILDTLRMRGSLTHTVLILCSTILTLVLLSGLTSGIVTNQEKALQSSPTCTLVSAWLTSGKGVPLSKATEAKWLASHPEIAAVIPDIKKVATARHPDTNAKIVNLTLQCTMAGDPLMSFHHADVLKNGERGLILSRAAAERLGVRFQSHPEHGLKVDPDQHLILTVTRRGSAFDNDADVKTAVRAVIDYGEASFAYADRQILDWIEDYQQGRSVPELGWKGILQKPTVTYDEYLSFSRRALEPDDITRLTARGLSALPLAPDDPAAQERRTLAGLLTKHELHVYSLQANGHRLAMSPSEVEEITDADDVVIPWVEPMEGVVNGKDVRVVGFSAQKRWLKPHFNHDGAGFPVGEDGLLAQVSRKSALSAQRNVVLNLAGGSQVPLQVGALSRREPGPIVVSVPLSWPMPFIILPGISELTDRTDIPPTVAVVSVDVLSNLRAVQRKELLFDRDAERFQPIPQENLYYQGRFYARTLHDVPELDRLLRAAGFTTQSERTHVEEIQRYARVLRLLVQFVGGIVLISGFLTLTVVLSDNTARKRGALGVLRLMGATRFGIVIFVVGRGLLIGIIAGVLLIPLSAFFAWLLTSQGALCQLEPTHFASVFGLAVGSSLLGVSVSALQATRSDPIENVTNNNH